MNKEKPDAPNGTPGFFVEIIIPQSVQKEKPSGKRSSAGSLYTFSEVCVLYFGQYKYYITHSAFFQCLSAGILPPSGCNVSALQCPAAGAAQRTAVRLSYGLPSQAVRF